MGKEVGNYGYSREGIALAAMTVRGTEGRRTPSKWQRASRMEGLVPNIIFTGS